MTLQKSNQFLDLSIKKCLLSGLRLFLFIIALISTVQAQDFLPPELAFPLKVTAINAQTISIEYSPQPGYYLYRDKFKFAILAPSDISLGAANIPQGIIKDDPTFGASEIFHQTVAISLPIIRGNSPTTSFKLQITSQGCAEAGICYPPDIRVVEVNLPMQLAEPATTDKQSSTDDTDSILLKMRNGGFLTTLVLFFVFGLGLALTPCVYPLTPILLSILVGQGQQSSLRRGFFIAFIYVQGMALTFAIAGVIAAFIGSLLSNILQNPWVLGAAAGVMVLFAFSMFGFFTIQLPSSWQNSLNNRSEKLNRGYLLTVFVMGVFSALVIGPCVAPPLFAALLYISQSNDVWLGGLSLLMLAQGMGVPLLIAGASAGKLLPRAGAWMNSIKQAFGFLLLALALWTVQAFLSKNILLVLSALLLVFSAIYMNVFSPQSREDSGWSKFSRGIAVALLFTGLYLLGVVLSDLFSSNSNSQLTGQNSNLKQKLSVNSAQSDATAHSQFITVNNLQQLQQNLDQAKAINKAVLIDYYADWCVSCIEMEKFTFSDAQVKEQMSKFIKLRIDLTDNSDEGRELLKKYQLFGPPAIIFYNNRGEIHKTRVIGFMPAAAFNQVLLKINKS